MPLAVSITLDDIYQKLGDFLATVVPVGVQVVQLPVDRASMPPPVPGYVGMTARVQGRIMTNLDRWNPADVNPAEITIEQAVRLYVQLDCYGKNAGDWAVLFSTVLRDEYGCTALAPILSPLFTENPMFAPLANGEEQYERRWIVQAVLQYNPVVSIPMQFADSAEAALINVDEAYPP